MAKMLRFHDILGCPTCEEFRERVRPFEGGPVMSREFKWVPRDFFRRGPMVSFFMFLSGASNLIVFMSIASWLLLAPEKL